MNLFNIDYKFVANMQNYGGTSAPSHRPHEYSGSELRENNNSVNSLVKKFEFHHVIWLFKGYNRLYGTLLGIGESVLY